MSYKIHIKILSLLLLFLVSALLFIVGYTALSIYKYGSQTSHLKADAAIILGAEIWGDQPSPVFRERINHGITLYKQGNVNNLIFTGGSSDGNELTEATVARHYAIEHGIPEADILIETKSRTTQQNLENALQVAASHKLSKFLIVSDPLHLKRALLMAKDLGMDAYPSPTPTTRYRSLKTQLSFLVRETYFYFFYRLLGF
ncbi:MAG: YdcF family protein [Nostocaceae cyanobacterium]|nr:YdcF family protein [Nostocaceae cyanobacterium]